MSYCEFTQSNKVPNVLGRQLDLVFSTGFSGEVSVAATDDALVPVDPHHPPLAASVCPAPAHPASPSSSPAAAYAAAHNIRPQWNFYKADYQLLYTMLTSADWSTLYETHDLDDILDVFYDQLSHILDLCEWCWEVDIGGAGPGGGGGGGAREMVRGSGLALVLACVRALLRPQHPRRAFNHYQMTRTSLLDHLLRACKERFLNSDCGPLDPVASTALVDVVRGLIGAPPLLHRLALLCDFLLLMHQASDTFVTHSRANFYFLLTSETQEMSEFSTSSSKKRSSKRGKKRNEDRPSVSSNSTEEVLNDNSLNSLKDKAQSRELDDRIDSSCGSTESTKQMKSKINSQIKEGRKHNASSTSENSDTTAVALVVYASLVAGVVTEGHAGDHGSGDQGSGEHGSAAPAVEDKGAALQEDLTEYIVVDVDDVNHTTVEMYTSGIYHQRRVRAGASMGWSACEGLLLLLRHALALLPDHAHQQVHHAHTLHIATRYWRCCPTTRTNRYTTLTHCTLLPDTGAAARPRAPTGTPRSHTAHCYPILALLPDHAHQQVHHAHTLHIATRYWRCCPTTRTNRYTTLTHCTLLPDTGAAARPRAPTGTPRSHTAHCYPILALLPDHAHQQVHHAHTLHIATRYWRCCPTTRTNRYTTLTHCTLLPDTGAAARPRAPTGTPRSHTAHCYPILALLPDHAHQQVHHAHTLHIATRYWRCCPTTRTNRYTTLTHCTLLPDTGAAARPRAPTGTPRSHSAHCYPILALLPDHAHQQVHHAHTLHIATRYWRCCPTTRTNRYTTLTHCTLLPDTGAAARPRAPTGTPRSHTAHCYPILALLPDHAHQQVACYH
ncbi:hypothetical protein HF086_007186 [Spodoptera exigua]|uniref:Uncharacterized protein n=1 Tax=Spodoptera exigua TaxID=7107 RepID=A0A922MT13_SPOEX|nr:hypothetical protein HF086_007186 [Spodoptera exigua]